MNIFKIVKGNSFVLHIYMQKASIDQNGQAEVNLAVASVNGLKVSLFSLADLRVINVPYVFTDVTNEIRVTFPAILKEGSYDIIISGTYEDQEMNCIEHCVLTIVDGNCQDKVPVGIVDGEQGNMYNASYMVELNADDKIGISYYGAQATSDAAAVNLSQLKSRQGSLRGQNITITTTDANDIAWVVSPLPLKFQQAHLRLSMHETIFNGMYYYCSDELKPGDSILYILTI